MICTRKLLIPNKSLSEREFNRERKQQLVTPWKKVDGQLIYSSVPERAISEGAEPKQQAQSQTTTQTTTAATSPEKQPSRLGILILAMATLFLYSFGLNDLSKSITGIVEALVQEAVQDYQF